MYKLRDVDAANSTKPYDDPEHKTKLQAEFFSMVSIVSCVPYLIVLYFSAIINEYVPQKLRNIGALVSVTVLFASVTAFVIVDTDSCTYILNERESPHSFSLHTSLRLRDE